MTSPSFSVNGQTVVMTTEMHSAGEPLRIIEQGARGCHVDIDGHTLLDKRRYVSERLDALRKFLMWEPRGHHDMYGALLVTPDHPGDADLAAIFMHNEGYSTMCGHAVIGLARYAVDHQLLVNRAILDGDDAEIPVTIQCPCGPVTAFVERRPDKSTTGTVRFHSVPAFAFALGVEVKVEVKSRSDSRSRSAERTVTVDIGYGGAFYAIVDDRQLGLDVNTSRTADIVHVADAVTEAVRSKVLLRHPDSDDLAFLYGTIVTDGQDVFSDKPTVNITVFADREVDRAPTGSGVTARVAVQYARGLIDVGQTRLFQSAATGSKYTGSVIRPLTCGPTESHYTPVTVQVSGTAYYTGTATFTAEDDDELKHGFLLK